MRLLVAYDGTPGADAALDDLRFAGLPERTSALVVCVASAGRAAGTASLLQDEARLLAEAGAARLRERFPAWIVDARTADGTPDRGVLESARRTASDLVVVGTRGLDAIERARLGSIARQVSTDADCSVRIARARARAEGPLRILVGCDGSGGADDAVAEVCRRAWPAETELRAVGVAHEGTTVRGRLEGVPAGPKPDDVAAAVERAAAALGATGRRVEPCVRRGDPAAKLLAEAQIWGADCVFLGGRRLRRLRRFVLGSVAGTVADEAACTVEVVRTGRS